ncbi:MAG: SDR family NAD(P)-dependent oxidoreductase [Pseudomonadota bacterium]
MSTISSPLSPTDLSGKTALVTGASRGIGFEAAKALGKAGAHVLALARTVGGLEELDDAIKSEGGTCSLIPADLADPQTFDALASVIGNRFGGLDILVGNAGVLGELAPLTDIDEEVWRQTFEINVHANWMLLKALDPLLRKNAARLAFVTSRVGGEVARAYWGAYGASKAAMENLVQTYAAETRNAGVRVAIIDPGPMQTKMRAAAMPGEDPATIPHPGELAPLIHHAVSPAYDGDADRLVFRHWREQGWA